MTRTLRIGLCIVALGVVWGSAAAEDGWTSSLGQFSRTLAQQRQYEATLANEFATHHLAFDPQLENPYYVVNDYHRRPHVYLDRRAFYVAHGNQRIDYRALSSLNDERVFPWTPYDDASWSHQGYGNGAYPAPYGDGYAGGQSTVYDQGRVVSGVRQVVPLEYRDSPRGTFIIGPGTPAGHR